MKKTMKTIQRNTTTGKLEARETTGEMYKGFFLYAMSTAPRRFFLVDTATGWAITEGTKKGLKELIDRHDGVMRKFDRFVTTLDYMHLVDQWHEMVA